MVEETRSAIQHVSGNWTADINQPLPIFCSPMCRRDVPCWRLEEVKCLELDVHSEIHSVTLPESCQRAPCSAILFVL